MPQLHLYVSDELADRLRTEAAERGMSLSKLLAEIVQRETRTGWPEGYFESVVGSWVGDFDEPDDPPFEERPPL